MKKHYFLLYFSILILTLRSQTVYTDYCDGRLYVKLKKNAAKAILTENPRNIPLSKTGSLREVLSSYGVNKITRPFSPAGDDEILPYVLKIEFTAASQVNNLIDALLQDQMVEYAEKVPLMKTDATPNEGIPTHLSQVNAANAWNVFNGNSNITVAIVDNAVMWNHIDLVQNTFTNTAEIAGNNVDDDNNGYVDDVNGYDVTDWDNNTAPTNGAMNHGTHCAGIAAGRTDNNTGIASIGWNIKFIPVKCQTNGGSTTVVANGYEGIVYAAKVHARVISCSWGGTGSSFTEQAAVNYAWFRGSIIIASAGNDNWATPNYPGAYNNVYCVAAINNSDVKSSYSNYGTWVDICAPGDAILSTVPYTTTAAYMQLSGTSMATPLVAGLAGLMLSKSPNMTQTDVLNCISTTAVNIYSLSGNSSYVTGNQLGIGRIEAFQAMNCAATYSALPPVANFYSFPQQTCPNTPVQFYDSSLYAPTSYAWVFQGGSPGTSTLANPVVQWSVAGTYSVQLTVTNAQGNNTKTKLSYITVSGPQSLPLTEGFQNSQFLPVGWTARNIGNDPMYWERKTGVGAYGTSTACAMFDNFNYFAANERDEMRTPKLDFSNVAYALLEFDVAYARFNSTFSDTLEVKVSTDCGVTWTSIYNKGGSNLSTTSDQGNLFVPSSTQWRTESVQISGQTGGQGNVMFSFINRGHYGQPIYVDNINIATPGPSLAINAPSVHCVGVPLSIPVATSIVSNFSWSFPGGTPSATTGLAHSVTYTSPGVYHPTLSVVNGTYNASVPFTIQVNGFPTVTVNQSTICSGTSATLTASGAVDYLWSSSTGTLSSNATLLDNPSSTTVYSVSGSNGAANGACSSQKSTTVFVNPTPTLVTQSSTICPGGTATITANGASSYVWSNGPTTASFTVSPLSTAVYTVIGTTNNCTAAASSTVNVASGVNPTIVASSTIVCPGDAITLTANGVTTYTWFNSSNGSQLTVNPASTTVYTLTGGNGVCTGTAQVTASVVPAPVINISAGGSATLCSGSTITLTASGANSYSWMNGPAGNTIAVTPNSNSTYTVTGAGSGCSRSATIDVTVIPLPQTVISFSNTSCNSSCDGVIQITGTQGAAPFTYSLVNTACSQTICPNLCSGIYTLVTSSLHNCTSTQTVLINSPAALSGVTTFSNATCSSCSDGAASVIASGGTAPYTYSWMPTATSGSLLSNVTAGCYTVTITDANNCSEKEVACIGSFTGLDEKLRDGIRIFPNPASSEINIETGVERLDYRLINHLGQLVRNGVMNKPNTALNTGDLARGIYYLEIRISGESYRSKIILQ